MRTAAIICQDDTFKVSLSFAEMIKRALEQNGFNVVLLHKSDPNLQNQFYTLLRARDLAFSIAITPNALSLPVNGVSLWKVLQGPVFMYGLDMPMYDYIYPSYEEMLSEGQDKVVFVYPDASYQSLLVGAAQARGQRVRTLFLPFAAEPQANHLIPWAQRPYDIVFIGNLGLELAPHSLGSTIEDTFSAYRGDLPFFQKLVAAVREIAETPASGNTTQCLIDAFGIDAGMMFDPHWRGVFCTTDSFIKRYRRTAIPRLLAGRNVHFFGHGWEPLTAANPTFQTHGPVLYTQQTEIIAQSKVVLNMDPNFGNGVHDRVFNAATHGAVALSQHNPFLTQSLTPGEGCLGYAISGADINAVLDRSDADLEQIAASGFKKVQAMHTWRHRIRALIDYAESL